MQTQKTEPILLMEAKIDDVKRIYINVYGSTKNEIGYYCYRKNDLIVNDNVNLDDDMLMTIWLEIYNRIN